MLRILSYFSFIIPYFIISFIIIISLLLSPFINILVKDLVIPISSYNFYLSSSNNFLVKLFSNYKKLSIYGWQLCDFDSNLLVLWLRLLLLLLSLLLHLSNKNFQTLSALLCFAHKVCHVRFYFKNILLKKPKSFHWEQIIAPLKDMNIIFQSTNQYHTTTKFDGLQKMPLRNLS